ncbi:MAG: PAS domain S-box protein [Bacteroidetes bacterium]|nr:PAS domain S-box protein [Bacteroidota bacterium]
MTAPKNKKTVLLVECSTSSFQELHAVLDISDYHIIGETPDEKKTINYIAEHFPDLVLIDLNFQESIETAKKIKQEYDIPFLFLVDGTEKEKIEHAKSLRPHGFITKPFRGKEILFALDSVMQQVQAEQEMQRSKQRLAATLNAVGDAVAAIDENGRILFMNNRAEHLCGWKEEESVGKPADEIFRLVDKKTGNRFSLEELNPSRRAENINRPARVILHSREEKELFIEIFSAPIYDEKKKNIGSVITLRDVTDQVNTAEALERAVVRLNLIARVTGEVVGSQSIQRQMHTISELIQTAFAIDVVIVRILENSSAKLISVAGLPDYEVTADLPSIHGITGRILNSKRALAINDITEIQDVLYPSGLYVEDKTKGMFVSCAGAPLLIGSSTIGTLAVYTKSVLREFSGADLEHLQIIANHMAMVIANNRLFKEIKNQNELLQQEIQVREQAEIYLRESEERYRSLVEFSPMAIAVHQNGIVKFVNEAGMRLIGASAKEEVIGKNIFEFLHPAYKKESKRRIEKVYGGSSAINFEQKWIRLDGKEIDVELSSISFVYNGEPAAQIIVRDISKQRENDLQLREAVQFTNEIISNAGEGIIVYDREYRYKLWNNYMERLTGIMQDSLLGKNVFEMFPHLLAEGVDKLIARALSGEVVTSEDVSHFVPGTIRSKWLSSTYAPHRNFEGKIIGVIVTLRDITDRKISEEALQESEVRFRTLFEDAKDAVFISDPKTGKIIDANREAELLLRRTREEIIGMHQTELHPPELAEEASNIFQESLLVLEKSAVEFEILRSDGVVVPVEINASAIRLDENRIVVQGIFRDITERKKAEQELREKEERYRAFVEQSSEGIYRTAFDQPIPTTLEIDEQIRLMYKYSYIAECNVVFAKMYGVETIQEVIGTRVSSLLLEDDQGNLDFMRKFISNGYRIFDYESREQDKAGEPKYFLNNGIGIMEDGMWTGVWGTQRDITEKKLLEEQLIQSQKLEGIGTLAGGIAHDFNNLLSMVLGTAELIKKQIPAEGKISTYVQKIIEASQRGASISKQLLLFARPEQAELKPIVINSFVKDICEFFSHFLPKSIVVDYQIHEDHLTIMGDDGQLHQVFLNLAINARDAMQNTGTLFIGAKRKKGTEIRKFIPHAEEIDYVRISISDTGIGMPDAVRRRIFEPFFSTKERGKGTGLGLSIVHGVVKLHKGLVDVKSQPNEGTTFYLYFPLVQVEPEVPGKIPSGSTEKHFESILIVDDEEMIREILKESLEEVGYNVFSASDGYEALKIFQARSEDIHIIISDLDMPIMNGYELFRNLISIDPNVNVIISSGYLEMQARKKLYDLGVREVITKPYKLEDILELLRTILNEGSS